MEPRAMAKNYPFHLAPAKRPSSNLGKSTQAREDQSFHLCHVPVDGGDNQTSLPGLQMG